MQTVQIPMEELMKVVQLQLSTAGRANLAVTGCSMLPMLRQGRDQVILTPVNGDLKPGDIALYQRENGMYVLHRVIRVTANGYRFCGDNQAQLETVTREQLKAVVAGYIRKGKEYRGNGLGDRLYRWCQVHLFGTRTYYIALRRKLGRLRQRLFKRRKNHG